MPIGSEEQNKHLQNISQLVQDFGDISISNASRNRRLETVKQLLDEIQAVEHLPIGSEERDQQLENIFIKQQNKIRFSSLQKLDLSNNKLDMEVAPILQDALETLDGLEEINLSNNKIGDAGFKVDSTRIRKKIIL